MIWFIAFVAIASEPTGFDPGALGSTGPDTTTLDTGAFEPTVAAPTVVGPSIDPTPLLVCGTPPDGAELSFNVWQDGGVVYKARAIDASEPLAKCMAAKLVGLEGDSFPELSKGTAGSYIYRLRFGDEGWRDPGASLAESGGMLGVIGAADLSGPGWALSDGGALGSEDPGPLVGDSDPLMEMMGAGGQLGFNGGGSAEGLGGLGTKGHSSGYGAGGASFWASERGPTVRLDGDPTIDGALDRSLIDEVVTRHMNQIRYCYSRDLAKEPEIKGTYVVKFSIEPNGTVSSAAKESSTVGHARVESCIDGRFLRMQFPKPKDGQAVTVSYPLLLAPTAD